MNTPLPTFQLDATNPGQPMSSESMVLVLYSKLLKANVPFNPTERQALDNYFRSVEP